MIKLIAFDLDGTLFNAKKEISAENMAALREAAARGVLLVPASGRLYPGLPEALKGPLCRYCILGNGLALYDAQEDKKLFEHLLSLEEARALFRYAESLGALYDCYADDVPRITRSMYDRLLEEIDDLAFRNTLRQLRRPVDDLESWLLERGKSVQKVMFYFTDPAERLRQLEEMPRRFPQYNVTSAVFCNIEINSRLADKGLALEALCRHLGLEPEETMALGDGLNDLGMIRAAGVGVAMGNADEAIKQAASWITDDCEHSGVARAIRRALEL